jgi:hypothetical protein
MHQESLYPGPKSVVYFVGRKHFYNNSDRRLDDADKGR